MSANRRHTIDMLHGSLTRPLFVFTLPLAVTGILQQLFNTADVLTLGHFVSTEAQVAIIRPLSVCWSIYLLVFR